MGSQSTKKLAVANTATLNQLLTITAPINVIAVLALFWLQRPANKIPYVVFSLPGWGCQYLLEKYGRPKYADGKVLKLGQDINQKGLYEYFFDVVYVTWILTVLMVVFGTNKVWYLFAVVPAYIGYTAYGFIAPWFGKGKVKDVGAEANTAPEKTKRQTKLEAKREKGGVRYR